jgi:SAM-dependent methyltransferase
VAALQALFGKLKARVPAGFKGDVGRLDTIIAAPSFEALYEALGLCYVIEPDGSPRQFADGAFDLIFRFHCLEHVLIGNVEDLLADFHRILKPGGYMIHQIGIDDHLQHYDAAESPKNYLRFSDRAWKLLFENDVQYSIDSRPAIGSTESAPRVSCFWSGSPRPQTWAVCRSRRGSGTIDRKTWLAPF